MYKSIAEENDGVWWSLTFSPVFMCLIFISIFSSYFLYSFYDGVCQYIFCHRVNLCCMKSNRFSPLSKPTECCSWNCQINFFCDIQVALTVTSRWAQFFSSIWRLPFFCLIHWMWHIYGRLFRWRWSETVITIYMRFCWTHHTVGRYAAMSFFLFFFAKWLYKSNENMLFHKESCWFNFSSITFRA